MNIISNYDKKTNYKTIPNTFLEISFKNDMSEHFGEVLPYPHTHNISNLGVYTYKWCLKGFFGTNKSIEFINDIKSRFLITFQNQIKQSKHYNTDNQKMILELKQFQKLKSISVSIINKTNRFDCSSDMVFWCLKLYSEEIIRERGLIQYETLLNYGERHFKGDVKDYSTLKAKCRSIVNYYINNDFTLSKKQHIRITKSKEEWIMTRTENMIKFNHKRKEENIRKVKNFLSGMFIEDYKKKNGEWNKKLISEQLKMSRTTITDILKNIHI